MNDHKIPRIDTDNENATRPPSVTFAPSDPMNPEAARIILELVQQVIATLLYFARAAHDKNVQAPAVVPFNHLPTAWQQDFANVAQMAVNGLEAEKRQAAERAALIHAERWLKSHLLHLVSYHVTVEGVAPEAIDDAVADMTSPTGPNIVTEVLDAYQEALCQK